jgi:16S rRNA (cytosine1402-N4)-methyltransferase
MHQAVLLAEVMQWLAPRAGGVYIDGTVGGGGHARAILEVAGPTGRLLALDRDSTALDRARVAMGGCADRCTYVHASFADLDQVAATHGVAWADGVLLDIGISSDQLDNAERGFSFMKDGPLDMRMDREGARTAADLVNGLSEHELADVLRRYGEEPRARAIARRIVQNRELRMFSRTGELADLVMKVYGGRRGRIHPATQTFQALRIAVNGELKALEDGLRAGLNLLAPGGRLVVISFHSLEDRIVKHFFADHQGRWESLPEGGRRWSGVQPQVDVLTRKPVMASVYESEQNPRARSAKLRAVERKR